MNLKNLDISTLKFGKLECKKKKCKVIMPVEKKNIGAIFIFYRPLFRSPATTNFMLSLG